VLTPDIGVAANSDPLRHGILRVGNTVAESQ